MAKRIDGAVMAAAMAAGYYLFFLNAWGRILPACLAALLCCALTRKVIRAFPRPRRLSWGQARARLLRLAEMDDAEAQSALSELLRRRFPGEAFDLCVVLKHPEASLSSGDILTAWKANRSAERLVVAATCPCEPRALVYSRELRQPRVAVVDSRQLLRLLRRDVTPVSPAPRPTVGARLRRALDRLGTARVSLKNALLAAALLALYLIQGNLVNLLAALALLLHLGFAIAQRRVGRHLFDGQR